MHYQVILHDYNNLESQVLDIFDNIEQADELSLRINRILYSGTGFEATVDPIELQDEGE